MDPERTAAKSRPQSNETGETFSSASDDEQWGTYFLGPYRIVGEIGVGGMATVELGRMDGAGGFQKWVAIKRIHSHLTEDEQFINMFLDEARIAARISHPNVAQVFDLGKDQDTYWIAMEYLHGEPLREIMRINEDTYGVVEPPIAARVIADAAEGLHAAHELRGKDGRPLNLVHRDVTPHNLFITYDGVVKVVDFGIAKVADGLSHTRAGTIKGKVAYMAPEQVWGKPVDRRTDIFALGVVLWEMTTGRRLFRVESDLGTMSRVEACVVPPPSSFDEDYPEGLEQVMLKALQREPSNRYQTAREFSRALQRYLMHANAFVGPAEISVYVKGLFEDRIRTREDHLRWAAEVTQTISLRKALTQEQPGSLDLSNLPRESSEFDTSTFCPETIREAALGTADCPKQSDTPPEALKGERDPLASTMDDSPMARAAGDWHDETSSPEIELLPEQDDDDDDDDDATLIASAPPLAPKALSVLGTGRLNHQAEPVDTEQELDESQTTAFVRGEHISLEEIAVIQSDTPQAGSPATDVTSHAARPNPKDPRQPAGPPVFDAYASPNAQTVHIRPNKSSGTARLVAISAAVGLGFIATGLAALWWIRTQAVSSPPSALVTAAKASAAQPDDQLTSSTPDVRPTGDARPGLLSVHCRPGCDTIIAGSQTFRGSVSEESMPPGSYRVKCIRGDVTKVVSIVVESDRHESRTVSMD